ncbi:MAG: energy transducer TonB [Methylococcaceae bacterium]
MFLFKDADESSTNGFLSSDGASSNNTLWRNLHTAMTGEEKPRTMWLLLGVLVILLHLWLFVEILKPRPSPVITEAKPLPIEVALVTLPKPEAFKPPAPPTPVKPPEPKKPEPKIVKKPLVKKKPAIVPKKADLPAEPVEVSKVEDTAPVAPTPTPVAPAKTENPKTEAFTEASFHANYGYNPHPRYPQIARSRGWEGRVLLRVHVSTEGLSTGIEVQQSSGHDILDESAIEAVNKWKFIPAKRGETAVASTVIVPINFTLKN